MNPALRLISDAALHRQTGKKKFCPMSDTLSPISEYGTIWFADQADSLGSMPFLSNLNDVRSLPGTIEFHSVISE